MLSLPAYLPTGGGFVLALSPIDWAVSLLENSFRLGIGGSDVGPAAADLNCVAAAFELHIVQGNALALALFQGDGVGVVCYVSGTKFGVNPISHAFPPLPAF